MNPLSRHYYEVIPEYQPCKLYFDIEYNVELNERINGDEMLEKFKNVLIGDLQNTFGSKTICTNEHIIDLCSNTLTKFSHHIIVNHHELIFANNYHVGRYVKYLCHKLKNAPEMQIVLNKKFAAERKTNCPDANDTMHGTFIDEGVYTKNRNFRIYLSSKFNKTACLKLPKNAFNLSDECIFLNSLVTNVCKQYKYHSQNNVNEQQRKYITFEYEDPLLPGVVALTDFKPAMTSIANRTRFKNRYLVLELYKFSVIS